MSSDLSQSWWSEYAGRVQRGDEQVSAWLVERTSERFESLARHMLRGFPQVRRWEQTGDVVQNASLRLLRALEQIELESPRHFLSLAATQIRRELIDLARHYQGPQGLGANHASQWKEPNRDDTNAHSEPIDPHSESPAELAVWCELHESIDSLPSEERDVCVMMFYHGLTQNEAAELLGVSERTVRRRWQDVRMKLHELMQTHF